MWIFTQTGFVSAVQHRDDKNLLVVRARDRLSLEPLAEATQAEITTNAMADYPYRVIVSKDDLAAWTVDQIDDLSYPNFKNQVAVTRGKQFASRLGSVWATMLEAEDAEAHQLRDTLDRNWGFDRA
jgi:hypothetical protein